MPGPGQVPGPRAGHHANDDTDNRRHRLRRSEKPTYVRSQPGRVHPKLEVAKTTAPLAGTGCDSRSDVNSREFINEP